MVTINFVSHILDNDFPRGKWFNIQTIHALKDPKSIFYFLFIYLYVFWTNFLSQQECGHEIILPKKKGIQNLKLKF